MRNTKQVHSEAMSCHLLNPFLLEKRIEDEFLCEMPHLIVYSGVFRRPLTVVVGGPVIVPKRENPTQEEVVSFIINVPPFHQTLE